MHGLQSSKCSPQSGCNQSVGYPNIAKLTVVLGAAVLASSAAGAADNGNTDIHDDVSANAGVKIVRPFELKVPHHRDGNSDAGNPHDASVFAFSQTVSVSDCVGLLGGDVDAVSNDRCKLYLVELH